MLRRVAVVGRVRQGTLDARLWVRFAVPALARCASAPVFIVLSVGPQMEVAMKPAIVITRMLGLMVVAPEGYRNSPSQEQRAPNFVGPRLTKGHCWFLCFTRRCKNYQVRVLDSHLCSSVKHDR